MRTIISDTSPIRYLVLVGEADILNRLYGQIVISAAVHDELQQPGTPELVRTWVSSRPSWIEVVRADSASLSSVSSALGEGERQAIALALNCGADLLLIDDRAAAREARRLGLAVTGTLGILVRAAEQGMVDLPSAVERLQGTNFRIHPKILYQLGL